jgi:hypothetical protein
MVSYKFYIILNYHHLTLLLLCVIVIVKVSLLRAVIFISDKLSMRTSHLGTGLESFTKMKVLRYWRSSTRFLCWLWFLKTRFSVFGEYSKIVSPLFCISHPCRDVYLLSICIWKVFSNTFFFMYFHLYFEDFLKKCFYLYLYFLIEKKTEIFNTNIFYFKKICFYS